MAFETIAWFGPESWYLSVCVVADPSLLVGYGLQMIVLPDA